MSNLFEPITCAILDWHHDQPFSRQFDDIYYPSASGIEQNRYVFVDGNELIPRWSKLPEKDSGSFTIAETGFGTGLNFLLAWKLWEKYGPPSATLHFISCELHPLNKSDLIKSLAPWSELKQYAEQLIDSYPILTPGYHPLSFCEGRVKLTLMLGDALECYEQMLVCGDASLEAQLRTSFIDAWYLDGFNPAKNEQMWSDPLLSVIAMLSRQGTTLATSTAVSTVKESLALNGFIVKKKKGFGSEGQMISAYFANRGSQRIKKRRTPWHLGDLPQYQKKEAIIIGAGLAGCFTANSLASRGWKVTLIEEQEVVGNGASGNRQAIVFPNLSAYRSPLTQLMLSGFLYATKIYQSILDEVCPGELKGTLILAHNEKEKMLQQRLVKWLQHYPELGRLVDASQASVLSGVRVDKSGLFIPRSGWLDTPALCHYLVKKEGVTVITSTSVDQLIFKNNIWKVNELEAEVLIIANGHKAIDFKQTQHLDLKSLRGQMTVIDANHDSALLKIPLCGGGHVLPQVNGRHYTGATYGLGSNDLLIHPHDDEANLAKLSCIAPAVQWSDNVIDHWAGIRAATPDYLPLVGPIAKADDFITEYFGMKSDAKRWIPKSGPYYPGLYACVGFGSRGLTTIPLCTEWLASCINNEPGCLPGNLIQAISPARFLRQTITRGKAID